MMGWIIIIAMAFAVFAGLIWLGKLPRLSFELVGAALLVGIAGYAWQGNPGFAGVSIAPVENSNDFDDDLAEQRNEMGNKFGGAQQWLILADALNRQGKHASAANYLRKGVQEHPNNPELWVGLGNALVVHADGIITPAAQFAFQRAANISPNHPGPPFFMGLALAQSGKLDQARAIWTELLDRSPKEAPWREDLESRLASIERMQPKLPQAESTETQ